MVHVMFLPFFCFVPHSHSICTISYDRCFLARLQIVVLAVIHLEKRGTMGLEGVRAWMRHNLTHLSGWEVVLRCMLIDEDKSSLLWRANADMFMQIKWPIYV